MLEIIHLVPHCALSSVAVVSSPHGDLADAFLLKHVLDLRLCHRAYVKSQTMIVRCLGWRQERSTTLSARGLQQGHYRFGVGEEGGSHHYRASELVIVTVHRFHL